MGPPPLGLGAGARGRSLDTTGESELSSGRAESETKVTMSLKTGAEFLQSLRDGREVWINGERVEDVTRHPRLCGCANSLAEIYDLQNDPAYAGVLTSISPRTGNPISRAWHLPRSAEDLTKGREMFEIIERH